MLILVRISWFFCSQKNNKHILKCCKFWTDNDTDLCFIAFSSFFEELWIYHKLLFSKLIKTLKYHIKTKIVQSTKMKESTFLTKIYYIWNNDLSRKIVITSVLIKLLTSAFNTKNVQHLPTSYQKMKVLTAQEVPKKS